MTEVDTLTEGERAATERALGIRRFTDAEMGARVARAQAAMATHRLDALLLSDEVNVKYFTGLATPSFATRARPLLVVVPASGSPVLICSRSQSAHARAASAIQVIEPFERFEEDALDILAGCLADRGIQAGRIGCELGREQRLGLTYLGFVELQGKLPGLQFVDGSDAIWEVRRVKSAEEVTLMRAASRLNSVAMSEAVTATVIGESEADIRRRWASALIAGGADRPGYFAIHSGPGSYRRVSGEATERPLRDGDLVWMDGGPVYAGYWSDITRMASVGTARPEDRARYSLAWTAVQETIATIQPGMTAGDVARRAAIWFGARGHAMGGASRIGHGIGAELTEPPSITDGDETELVPGMTLSIETGIAAWDGYFLMEDNIVVTEDGAELLSDPAPAELVEVG